MTMHLENSEEMLTFVPDDESQKTAGGLSSGVLWCNL